MRKILSFPTPYPNELFYGTVARYQEYTGVALTQLCKKLFQTTIAPFDVSPNLIDLCQQLGRPYTPDYIFDNHSLYYVYTPFVNKNSQEIAYHNLLNGKGVYAIMHLKIPSIKRGDRAIMYCPKCANNDLEKYGEAYIHREHQIPNILCCHKHGNYLIEYNKEERFIYLNPEKFYDSDEAPQICQLIARMAVQFLEYNIKEYEKEDFAAKFRTIIKNNGYSKSSRLNMKLLSTDILDFYGSDVLSLYNCIPDYNSERKKIQDKYYKVTSFQIKRNVPSSIESWLKYIIYKTDTSANLVKYLLLINFFGLNINDFLNVTPEYRNLSPIKKPEKKKIGGRRKAINDDEILELLREAYKKRINEKPYRKIGMGTLFAMIGMSSWQWNKDTLVKSIAFAQSVCQTFEEGYLNRCKDTVDNLIKDGMTPTIDLLRKKLNVNYTSKPQRNWFKSHKTDLINYINKVSSDSVI